MNALVVALAGAGRSGSRVDVSVDMPAMNPLAHDLAQAQLVNVEALGQTEAHIQKAVVDAFHADADGPAVLLAARLRVAGHRHAFRLIPGSLAGVRGGFLAHKGSLARELFRWMFCAGANTSSSA